MEDGDHSVAGAVKATAELTRLGGESSVFDSLIALRVRNLNWLFSHNNALQPDAKPRKFRRFLNAAQRPHVCGIGECLKTCE